MADVKMSDPVRQLLAMDAEVVPARFIAPVLKMSESVLLHRVKSGLWDQDNLGKYVISGNRVKFFRKDFLIKCGFMEPEPEEDIRHRMCLLLAEAKEHLRIIERMLACMMSPHQRDVFQVAIAEEVERERRNEKTAGVAAPAEEKEP